VKGQQLVALASATAGWRNSSSGGQLKGCLILSGTARLLTLLLPLVSGQEER
jgi:hypothetical protein